MNYINATNDYLKEKVQNGQYTKCLIEKTGQISARLLKKGEVVQIYFYNDMAEIETKSVKILFDDQILVTKTINNKQYNSIMTGLKFHKTYRKTDILKKSNLYIPVIDPLLAYEVNENIIFINIFNQTAKLCPGDFIVPYDASQKSFYSIFKYNFLDNYAFRKAFN